ncbi:MAG: hypothetical protein F6K09_07570 [Merismopedia sp. SIO2A8]|nr:hypothetical protein [Symploca sp. SIO2B6]NET48578.1 hypothetical protein [Merismopedia sp. SIO2A8]
MIEPNLSSNLFPKPPSNPAPSLSPNNFLTEEESIAVDQTLMPAKDKFSTRVAIYSLRVLQSMATQQSVPQPTQELGDRKPEREDGTVGAIAPDAIIEWLAQHQPPTFQTTPGLETDPAFNQFFAQLVLSALKPLNQISAQLNKPITDLTPPEIIAWFEQNVQL